MALKQLWVVTHSKSVLLFWHALRKGCCIHMQESLQNLLQCVGLHLWTTSLKTPLIVAEPPTACCMCTVQLYIVPNTSLDFSDCHTFTSSPAVLYRLAFTSTQFSTPTPPPPPPPPPGIHVDYIHATTFSSPYVFLIHFELLYFHLCVGSHLEWGWVKQLALCGLVYAYELEILVRSAAYWLLIHTPWLCCLVVISNAFVVIHLV